MSDRSGLLDLVLKNPQLLDMILVMTR